MTRFTRATLLCLLASGVGGPARADEQEAKAVIDKAIKAIGRRGEALRRQGVLRQGQGQDHHRRQRHRFHLRDDRAGDRQVPVDLRGRGRREQVRRRDGARRRQGLEEAEEELKKLDGEGLAKEKRNAYLDVIPTLLVPLKGKGFKVESAAEEKVGDKPAAVVRVTGPDGKDFTLYFDKESGLPVKMQRASGRRRGPGGHPGDDLRGLQGFRGDQGGHPVADQAQRQAFHRDRGDASSRPSARSSPAPSPSRSDRSRPRSPDDSPSRIGRTDDLPDDSVSGGLPGRRARGMAGRGRPRRAPRPRTGARTSS